MVSKEQSTEVENPARTFAALGVVCSAGAELGLSAGTLTLTATATTKTKMTRDITITS